MLRCDRRGRVWPRSKRCTLLRLSWALAATSRTLNPFVGQPIACKSHKYPSGIRYVAVGRRRFTPSEADQIRRLLREKGVADASRQKTLRGQLRRSFDFYISDFTEEHGGFTAWDFDALVARGTIEIGDSVPDPRQGVDDPVPSKDVATESGAVLSDVLAPGLRVVFCGTAVGTTSAQRGAYYAGPGNRFWSVLARVGLTPRQLAPAHFRELPNHGIGLTDLAKYAAGTDEQVSSEAFDTDAFREKIEATAPRAVAFNGKRAAEAVLGRSVAYGQQPERIGAASIFVLPSTSGAARGFWDESHWLELAQFVTSD